MHLPANERHHPDRPDPTGAPADHRGTVRSIAGVVDSPHVDFTMRKEHHILNWSYPRLFLYGNDEFFIRATDKKVLYSFPPQSFCGLYHHPRAIRRPIVIILSVYSYLIWDRNRVATIVLADPLEPPCRSDW